MFVLSGPEESWCTEARTRCMAEKVKAQTTPNKDVQKEIADMTEVSSTPPYSALTCLESVVCLILPIKV